MRYINVEEDYVGKILAANKLVESEQLSESNISEEHISEDHVCPLCESELDQPIPEENMQECVNFILDTINEAMQHDGEYLEEEYEVGTDDDEDEMTDEKGSEDKSKKAKKC
jgi:hypothetical protein